jgi:type VI secretion system protein ImpJ
MTTKAVHWHEGMFLRPHHYQAAQRHSMQVSQQQQKWDVHYNWGLRALEIDFDALANYRFVVEKLQARFRDGTTVSIPEDGTLEPLALRKAFSAGNSFVVSLAIPVLALGQANATVKPDRPARYVVETVALDDENTGTNTKQIQVRRLNLRLVTSHEAPPGHELLPLARLEKSNRAEAAPQLDAQFIPPLLACDAWAGLQVDTLQAAYNRVGKKIDLLAKHALGRGLTFETGAQGASALMHQLRELNEIHAVLHVLAFCPGVHPLHAYLELCRAAGQLAVFGDARRAPDMPRYEHDELARCFGAVRRHIDLLLDAIDEPPYDERPFHGAGSRMQVPLEPAWLEAGRRLFIGVQSPLSVDECRALLSKGGILDMKVGGSGRVEENFRTGEAGLEFLSCEQPPRVRPRQQGRLYFEINRAKQDLEWQHVQNTLSLAIRVSEKLVVGSIHGQRSLTIKHGGRTVPLDFTLYVVTP